MPFISKANPDEMAPFYHTYLDLVAETDVLTQMQERLNFVKEFWGNISPEKHDFAYADGKWTIKQVLGHLIDAERIFAYRALRIARGEKQSLPGFDENEYVKNANFPSRTLADLLEEFETIRKGSILLFEHSDSQILDNQGISSENPITVRALASIIVGHEVHHSRILAERYL